MLKTILSEQKVTFNNKSYPTSGWAVMMAGIPGAGKSTAIKNYLLLNAKILDPDLLKKLFIKKAEKDLQQNIQNSITNCVEENFNGRIPNLKNEDDATKLHYILMKEKRLFSKFLYNFLKDKKEKDNFILDATGNKINGILSSSKLFKEIGYNVSVVLVASNLEIAKKRVLERKEKEGRAVNEEYIEFVYDRLIKNFKSVLNTIDTNFVDEFWIVLNTNTIDISKKMNNCIKLKKENGRFVIENDLLKEIQANKKVSLINNILKIINSKNTVFSATITPSKKRSIPVDSDEIIELLNTKYSQACKKAIEGDTIYRGVQNANNESIREVTPGVRVSENTSNIYTRLFSEILPSWKEFPKRNRSTVATTDHFMAEEYGDIYVVLPENNTKIGICPSNDIWYSFDNSLFYSDKTRYTYSNIVGGTIALFEINKYFQNLVHFFLGFTQLKTTSIFEMPNTNMLISFLNNLDKTINEFIENKYSNDEFNNFSSYKSEQLILVEDVIKYKIDTNKTLIDYLDYILNSKNFSTQNIKDFKNVGEHEVWFEGSCLQIEIDTWFSLKKKLKNNIEKPSSYINDTHGDY